MNFEELIKSFSIKVSKIKESIVTEEATKTSIIMPFFQMLGYDIFNPSEFIPEYIADIGIKKGEKVDYAISLDGEISMLIEAKAIDQKLEKHDSQLFRYFGTSKAKFAILTNGLIYRFYTDLEKTNVMDSVPFLEINIEELTDNDIGELKKFCKESFDVEYILSAASDLKCLSSLKKVIKEEFNNPSDEFVKMILNKGIYEGVKTQVVLDKYRLILKKSLSYYINDSINEMLQKAMQKNVDVEDAETVEEASAIVTTTDEIDSYYTVKAILTEFCDSKDIYYKDTANYFAILYDNKVTKWICRIYLKENVKYIVIPDKDRNEVRYDIGNVNDIYKYKRQLTGRLSCFIKDFVDII